jgi:hypothetical protein
MNSCPQHLFALENKQYRLMWTGTLFSFLGMQMQVITRGTWRTS